MPPAEHTSVAIIAMFHTTGAVYERKNLRWLFRIPRHHADNTSSAAPGNRIRTSRMVSSRLAPWNPGAITSVEPRRGQHARSTRAPT